MYKSLAIYIFGSLLISAFLSTNNIEYINKMISILQKGLKLQNLDHVQVGLVISLMDALTICLHFCHFREDLDEIMQLCQMAVNHRSTKISDQFWFSCKWAQFSQIHSHPSTSTAYDYTLSLMQD